MASLKGICITLLLSFSFALAFPNIKERGSVGHWIPVDWHTLPKANPTDKIQVLYLVAPLLEGQYGPWLGYADLFHGAIAFRNINQNNFSLTINYDADNFIHSSVFPYVHTDPNGTRWLEWQNGGANFIYVGINDTYWTKTMEVVANINGDIYNNFISTWNAEINTTHPYYDMFSVLSHFQGTLYVDGWDCFDYAVTAMQILYQLGADFITQGPLGKDDINIYTSIVPVKMTQQYNTVPAVRETIIDFFELIQAQTSNMTIFEIALTVLETFDGTWYVYEQTDYYEIKLNWPFFGLDFVTWNLPGGSSEAPKIIKSPVALPLVKVQ